MFPGQLEGSVLGVRGMFYPGRETRLVQIRERETHGGRRGVVPRPREGFFALRRRNYRH